MGKIRNLVQFQEALDTDMSWRIKELSYLSIAAKTQESHNAFVRAGVALVYAHWEGFVKFSAESYINFIVHQSPRFRDVRSCFILLGLRSKVAQLVESKQSKSGVEAVEFLIGKMDDPIRISYSSAIDAESNLTSKVFSNIAASLGISVDQYEARFNLIDESLVARRNRIAHGEYLDLNRDDFLDLLSQVTMMLRWFKTDLENAASLRTYLKAV